MTNEERLAKLEKSIDKAKRRLKEKRAELRAKELERRKREFDRLPAERRKILEALGWSPYQDGVIIRRTCGKIEAK